MSRTVTKLAVAVLGVALLSGCATRIDGVAGPVGSYGSTSAPAYSPPPDGSGFSLKPADQQQPLPSLSDPHGCDFLDDWQSQLSALGALQTALVGSGCEFILPDNEYVQVRLAGPYEKMVDPPSMVKPVSLDGLDGRYYSLVPPDQTMCSIELNTRSLYAIAVDAWNSDEKAGTQDGHCKAAAKYADVIVRKYVPAAGGTPWAGTGQQPTAQQLAGKDPCGLVDYRAVYYAQDLEDKNPKQGRNSAGATCKYQASSGVVDVLLSSAAGGLSALPTQVPGATVTAAKLGVLPSRVESAGTMCGVAAQLVTGQVVEVIYTPKLSDPSETCMLARVVLSVGLMNAIEGSTAK